MLVYLDLPLPLPLTLPLTPALTLQVLVYLDLPLPLPLTLPLTPALTLQVLVYLDCQHRSCAVQFRGSDATVYLYFFIVMAAPLIWWQVGSG